MCQPPQTCQVSGFGVLIYLSFTYHYQYYLFSCSNEFTWKEEYVVPNHLDVRFQVSGYQCIHQYYPYLDCPFTGKEVYAVPTPAYLSLVAGQFCVNNTV